jgi:hypothetical protein
MFAASPGGDLEKSETKPNGIELESLDENGSAKKYLPKV